VTPYITALDYTSDAEDEFDLAVGMSNGEVKVFSLAAQLSVRGPKPTLDGPVLSTTPSTGTNSRCLSVTWEPMAKGRRLVSIHADGSVRLEEKIGGPEDLPVLQPSMALRPTDILESATWSANSVSATATAAAPSPCGRYLALACRDGTLRVFSLSTGVLYGGCSSYYGGLLCLAWSPDGRYIAAGGEDDLIFLWSAEDNRLVAHLEGHLSYITAVAFDGESPGVPYSYRVASVAMDCALGLWEVNCGEGAEVTTPRAIHATHTVQGDSPVGGRGTSGTVLPPVPRAAMTFVSPLSLQKVHGEPLCDVKFLKNSLLVASNDGTVKRWRRPVHVVAG
jgi:WD40 repeat protein